MSSVDMHGHLVHTWTHTCAVRRQRVYTVHRPINKLTLFRLGESAFICHRRRSDGQRVLAVRGRLPLGNRRAITPPSPAVFYYHLMHVMWKLLNVVGGHLGFDLKWIFKIAQSSGYHTAPACQFQDSRQICE